DKGGKLQVNDLLAIIGKSGEDVSGLVKESGQKSVVSSKETVVSSQQSVAGSQEKETKNKKEETSSKEPATSNKQQTAIDVSKMEEVVLMPRLSDTMTDGVIAAWHKNVGDTVKKGEVLAEIETDKATMELESYKNGKLLYIGAKNGEKIAVNELLCIIGEEGKVDVNAIVEAAKSGVVSQPGQTGQMGQKVKAQSSSDKVQESKVQQISTSTQQQATGNGRIKASPLAKNLAKEKGIDISKIHGSGDGGRIIKADVDSFKSEQR
ncbi:MAG: biotin/lipoyl-containing protein, partial [Chitinophagales bacterium]